MEGIRNRGEKKNAKDSRRRREREREREKEEEEGDRWFEPKRRNNQRNGRSRERARERDGNGGGGGERCVLLKETGLIYPFTYIQSRCIKITASSFHLHHDFFCSRSCSRKPDQTSSFVRKNKKQKKNLFKPCLYWHMGKYKVLSVIWAAARSGLRILYNDRTSAGHNRSNRTWIRPWSQDSGVKSP